MVLAKLRDYPLIVTLVGAIAVGCLVRTWTQPAEPAAQSSPRVSPPTAPRSSAAAQPAPFTPAEPVVATAPAPAAAPSLPAMPVSQSVPSYSGRRGAYTSYSFTLDGTTYPLDGQTSFDHLCEMKRQANLHEADINRLRAVCRSLSDQIDRNQAQIRLMRATVDSSDEFAVDQFNAQVARSNQVVEQYRAQQAELNGYVDQHNAIVDAMHVYARQHGR